MRLSVLAQSCLICLIYSGRDIFAGRWAASQAFKPLSNSLKSMPRPPKTSRNLSKSIKIRAAVTLILVEILEPGP